MERISFYLNKLLIFACVFLILLLPSILAQIPNCEFHDTVNITGSFRFANGSYLHDGVIIPPELIGEYSIEVLYKGHELPVEKHIRGCICKLRTCVKFCCHPPQTKIKDLRECETGIENELELSPYVNITFNNGTEKSIPVLEEFSIVVGIPCHNAYKLIPDDPDDEWKLYENGTMKRLYDNAILSRRDYCLAPHNKSDVYSFTPMNCPNAVVEPDNLFVDSVAMLISIPFFVLTILVYACLPKLRNLHGKCLICYLISLTSGYSHLVMNNFYSTSYSDFKCTFLGFTGYFSFMAAYLWLNVISIDLWHNFRLINCNVNRYIKNKRFTVYSLYAWGMAGALTLLTLKAQYSDFDYSLKPGIGDQFCWVKHDDWSAMIYFYGPMMLLIFFNIIMFSLISINIYNVKKGLKHFAHNENSEKYLQSQKENFGLFLRLFIVMGIIWMLDVLSYIVGPFNIWAVFFYIPDFCIAAQGIVIFILFVLKQKVIKLIKKRINPTKELAFYLTNKKSKSEKSTSRSQTNDTPKS
ncbi:G-protein coupled receptor Mth2-like isoform X2 [Teleopsis dalmanni]|uniref:G-protein coupled receptor Mth2-like isoform X2 n=1 Tax=Teleopsis dalmanni TaxID=139649 RepID=UPI0018CEF94F|nr:G-protein coupled receptor Mth2-like isoform X2 [Teleopsis dalmanni]